MKRPVTDLAASVRARLLAMATPKTNEFQDLLARYARERLLYRLSKSEWHGQFVLKGAALFVVWSRVPHRSTRDLDLLGFMLPDPRRLEEMFRAICRQDVEPDGLVFLEDSVQTRKIREEEEYQGIRVTLSAMLKRTRIAVQVDIGTGDKVVPPPEDITYPTLLAFPAPQLRAYSRYTVVAEKFEAMAELAMANSRMRDYYDIWSLTRSFDFDGDTLRSAVEATFERRRIVLSETVPVGLSDDLAGSAEKQAQWQGFLHKSVPAENTVSLREVVEGIRAFLEPVLSGSARGRVWRPGTGWQRKD